MYRMAKHAKTSQARLQSKQHKHTVSDNTRTQGAACRGNGTTTHFMSWNHFDDDGRQVEIFEKSDDEVDADERRGRADGQQHRLAEADLLAAAGGEAAVGAAVDRYRCLFFIFFSKKRERERE